METIRISVRNLVEFVMRSGDLDNRRSQEFKKGMALVDGHGNFGSIEGDGAAAMRYTEARLEKFAQEVY